VPKENRTGLCRQGTHLLEVRHMRCCEIIGKVRIVLNRKRINRSVHSRGVRERNPEIERVRQTILQIDARPVSMRTPTLPGLSGWNILNPEVRQQLIVLPEHASGDPTQSLKQAPELIVAHGKLRRPSTLNDMLHEARHHLDFSEIEDAI